MNKELLQFKTIVKTVIGLYFLVLANLLSAQIVPSIKINYLGKDRFYSDYDFDGRYLLHSAAKLTNPAYFGQNGVYKKSVHLQSPFFSKGSLEKISKSLNTYDMFFWGNFNLQGTSETLISNAERDSLYNWSLQGGKMIITSGFHIHTHFDDRILNDKWNYKLTYKTPFPDIMTNDYFFYPTALGAKTRLFDGPFGKIRFLKQWGSAQGYYIERPENSVVLATATSSMSDSKASIIMDCNTLDLLIADVDVISHIGRVTQSETMSNDQDKFIGNIVAFMDNLQDLPEISYSNGELTLNDKYQSYQWFKDGVPISEDSSISQFSKGEYRVEVSLNGGCKKKSNRLVWFADTFYDIPSLNNLTKPIVPSAFSPNGDGLNDVFAPYQQYNINYLSMEVFNSFGEKIFSNNSSEPQWDGTYRDVKCMDGTYLYIVKYEHKETEKVLNGLVTLMR